MNGPRDRRGDTAGALGYRPGVTAIRHLLAQRRLALPICVAALLLRLLIPSGYMIDSDHGQMTVTICSGMTTHVMTVAVPGLHGDMAGHGKAHEHGKSEMPCAFSGLAAATLGSIDPIQLAALIAFVMAVGLAAASLPAPSRRTYLRPPLRGPPLTF